jgi:hypothetical protein
MNGRMTVDEGRAWLEETEALRAEYRMLSVVDDRLMRSADRKRFNTLSVILTMREKDVEDILRRVVTMEVEIIANV